MLNPFAGSSGARGENSLPVQWALLESVFGDLKVIATSPLILTITGLIAVACGGPPWLLALAAAAFALLAIRFWTSRAFRHRAAADPPALWANRFAYGAWATGALWGICALIICAPTSGYIKLLVVSTQSALAFGAAVRNAAVPKAVIGQLNLSLLPMIAACLWTGRRDYALFCILIAIQLYSALEIAATLRRRAERLLRAEQAMKETNEHLAAVNLRLASLATTDGLTGLANRRQFDEALDRACGQAIRTGAPLACLLLDIDQFKLLNDSQGHLTGDDRLREVAAALRQQAGRPGDLVARYGGEEFAVVLENTDIAGALVVAERLRAAVEALALPHPASSRGIVTISGGVAAGSGIGVDPTSLLQAADHALYQAKSEGRNRICRYDPLAQTIA